jgi:hypothetical protein
MRRNKRRKSKFKEIARYGGNCNDREACEIAELLNIYDPDASENIRAKFWDVASPVLKSKWYFLSEYLKQTSNYSSLSQSRLGSFGEMSIQTTQSSSPPTNLIPKLSDVDFEKKLWEHWRHLFDPSVSPGTFNSYLEKLNIGLRQKAFKSTDYSGTESRLDLDSEYLLAYFSPYFCRDGVKLRLHSDNDYCVGEMFVFDEQRLGLCCNLIAEANWNGERGLIWSIILGQNGSLEEAASFFKWRIFPKFQFHFENLPWQLIAAGQFAGDFARNRWPCLPVLWHKENLLRSACLWAEVRRLGGSDTDFRRIHSVPGYAIDPTDSAVPDSFYFHWREVLTWLIRHTDQISDEEAFVFLEYFFYQFTGGERDLLYFTAQDNYKEFAVRSVSLDSMRNMSKKELFVAHFAMREAQSWAARGFGRAYPAGVTRATISTAKWEFVELCSEKSLANELEHLGVASLKGHCVPNCCEINIYGLVALRFDGEPRVIIKHSLHGPVVKEYVCWQGRTLRASEARIISHWLNEVIRPVRIF